MKNQPITNDDLEFQRCVDGELTDAEEIALLRRLEHDPPQWRRLALAFIEDRQFSRSMCHHGSMYHHSSAAPVSVANLPVTAGPQTLTAHKPRATSLLQLASVLALSLTLGVALGLAWVQWPGRTGAQRPVVVLDEPDAVPQPPAPPPPVPLPRPLHAPPRPAAQGTVSLVANKHPRPDYELDIPVSGAESVRVPVYDPHHMTPEMFTSKPVISAEIQDQLRQRGYAVDQQRQYLMIPLQDGRRVLVPHDTVKVRYAVQ